MPKLVWIVCATLALLMGMSQYKAGADEISNALPENLHKPLSAFLSASGWRAAERMIRSASHAQLTESIFVIRVADESTCDTRKDLCLTVIGTVRNGGFGAEAVFYAGERMEVANNAFAFGGAEGPSLFFVRFFGKKQTVIVAPAPTGWIVIPSGAIDDFKGPAQKRN